MLTDNEELLLNLHRGETTNLDQQAKLQEKALREKEEANKQRKRQVNF